MDTVKDRENNTGKLTLTSTGSSVTIKGTENNLDIGSFTTDEDSSTQFVLNHVAEEGEKVLSIETVEGAGNIGVGYTGAVSDQLQAGTASAAQLFDGIAIGEKSVDDLSVAQGVMGDELALSRDEKGNIVTRVVRVNDLIRSTQDLAMTNALMWRSQLTNLTDRLGTLRTMP